MACLCFEERERGGGLRSFGRKVNEQPRTICEWDSCRSRGLGGGAACILRAQGVRGRENFYYKVTGLFCAGSSTLGNGTNALRGWVFTTSHAQPIRFSVYFSRCYVTTQKVVYNFVMSMLFWEENLKTIKGMIFNEREREKYYLWFLLKSNVGGERFLRIYWSKGFLTCCNLVLVFIRYLHVKKRFG